MKRRAPPSAPRLNRRPQAADVAHPERRPHGRDDRRVQRRSGAPWHFWLVVVMATVYLGWRAIEGIVWLIQWIGGAIG
ncbi:hypothetical protein [Candidatus Poriferisodalis sp.]|uniref:hypothetical protein n=1 Tax=Candidatus Poriferisodalis sp. TaxID=3101277 RepID=UPI003C6F3C53